MLCPHERSQSRRSVPSGRGRYCPECMPRGPVDSMQVSVNGGYQNDVQQVERVVDAISGAVGIMSIADANAGREVCDMVVGLRPEGYDLCKTDSSK